MPPTAPNTPQSGMTAKQLAAAPLPPFPYDDRNALVLPGQVAKYRCTSEGTLAYERSAGTGIPYVKIGRKVYYRAGDVLDFVAARVVDPADKGRSA